MKNQTRIRKEFKKPVAHTSPQGFTHHPAPFSLCLEITQGVASSLRLELSDQVRTSSGKLTLRLPGGFTSRIPRGYPRHLTRYSILAPLPRRRNNSSTR
eukprot:scaffold21197_cov127-Isochrysis_galbana.AAC.3